MKKISKVVVNYFSKNNSIPKEDYVYYVYGVELLLNNLFIFFSIFTIGLLRKSFLFSILYSLSFCALRSYVGGHHCKTYLHCYLLSIIGFIVVILVINPFFESHHFLTILVFLLSFGLLLGSGHNKKRSLIQIKVFLSIYLFLFLLFSVFRIYFVQTTMVDSTILVAILLLAQMKGDNNENKICSVL